MCLIWLLILSETANPVKLRYDTMAFKVFCVLNYEKKNLQKILKNYDNLEIVNFQFPKNFSLFSIFSSIFNMIRIFKDIQPELIISCNRNSSFIARLCCFFYKAKFNVYIAFGFYFHDKQNKISFIFSFLLEKFLSIKNDLILSQSEYDTNLAKFTSVGSEPIEEFVMRHTFPRAR